MANNNHASGEQNQKYEPKPDAHALTAGSNVSEDAVDYEPHPEKSIQVEPLRQKIINSICNLYSGSASGEDMKVYAKEAVYDDPWSYCDTRYKIAGQWWGIPMIFASSKTLKTETVSNKPNEITFKLQQEYTPRALHWSKSINSLVTLTLDDEGKVRYHKDMWNAKDYSHEGIGMVMKHLNGDHLTKFTRPPDWL
ncbi:hypothetical protein P152DRAFT_282959 [Eremomyces bilateralis CBS 781.70]|uniref:Uncharacterized protein n=1 Tax=Eremomyces bilateralis CBS 781.70 TaxID=1392243 RepID=A0A6G1G9H7_9PEZI|nr:uncharacterized protein P152DRAFT_282959 [Eremomyces bilateralis CBS 781.70]KAF1814673.1 hypothetical protein P152DRAFT_282959 [Eremomyces bilateralis CBS 781.70]